VIKCTGFLLLINTVSIYETEWQVVLWIVSD